MKSFYECNLFTKKDFQISEQFVVEQEEIVLAQPPTTSDPDANYTFKKQTIEYKCFWLKQDNWDSKKPTILIPIRDNKILIDVTIKNLKETVVLQHANVIIIDDRSEEDIKGSAVDNGLSYLRVDNDKGFNFSMLNNIAAKICYDLNNTEIILWNSDLWCEKEEWFLELMSRHRNCSSKLSGSKLLYPPIEMSLNKQVDSDNIKKHFPHMSDGKWRGTVQFGGSYWIRTQQFLEYSPLHYKRFANPGNPLVNNDRGSDFVTGALQVWDLEHFISMGGLNPSLSKVFQDVDACLRSVEAEEIPMYFGKDIHFHHDESFNMYNAKDHVKEDHQYISDHVLFAKLWNEKIVSIVLA